MKKQPQFLRKLFTLTSKLLLIVILWLGGIYAFETINNLNIIPYQVRTEVQADGPVNIWWPTQNAIVGNTQTFKARIEDKALSDYDMFWFVGTNGQLNQMADAYNDAPHKEAIVDMQGWNWNGSGPYKITFRAVDKSGKIISESSVDISTTATQVLNTVQAQVFVPVVSTQSQNKPVQDSFVATKHMSIWWPTNNSTLTGTQPFKTLLDGVEADSYKMYWQVDNGQLNEMGTNNSPIPHKEVAVDLKGWTWNGRGPYNVQFVAKDMQGTPIASSDIILYVDNPVTPPATTVAPVVETVKPIVATSTIIKTVAPTTVSKPVVSKPVVKTTVAPTPVPAPIVAVQEEVVTPSVNQANPFQGQKLFMNYDSDARHQADAWRSSRPEDAAQMDKIAQSPDVVWLGNWNSDISSFVKSKVTEIKAQGALPVFIAYNIPNRDCGQYSAGGVNSADAYKSWIQKIADAIGSNKAVVVLEPDGTTLTSCLSGSQVNERYATIKSAVSILKAKSQIAVYIDAGHPNWISASDMADRLTKSGVAEANGFSLNISNFYTTSDNIKYGEQISNKIGGKHFVIDTGRNGLGGTSDNQWCNPVGRALGIRPTTNTGNSLVDAYLWIKGPGGSDGTCNGGPSAGSWWADYALDMARRSVF